MAVRKAVSSLVLTSLSFVCGASVAQAQTAPPTAYTVVEAVANGIPGTMLTVNRSGSKVQTVLNQPAQGDTPAARMVTIYDLQAHTSISWNSLVHPLACSAGTFSGDWGDPFAMASEITSGVAKGQLKLTGTEMVAGVSTEVYTGNDAQASTKAWFDKADGLVMRAIMKAPGGAPMTLVDIHKVTLTAPAANLFVPPATCAGVKPPPSAADLIAEETGDDAANYVNGSMGPGTPNTCSVVLRVVHEKTLAPVEHIQVAVDMTLNADHPPHYEFGVRDDGSQTYAGGGVKEITSAAHNGVVKLGNPPAYFGLGVNVIHPGHGGDVTGVYRHCFGPTTVLLYVVKDDGLPTQTADPLWVKAGKNATPPH